MPKYTKTLNATTYQVPSKIQTCADSFRK